ncbi:MAG: mechanosensitive ion channel family protein [Nitrososphaerales archaeon]
MSLTIVDVMVILISLAAAFLLAVATLVFFRRYIRRFAARTKTRLDDVILSAIEWPLMLLILGVGVVFSLRYLNEKIPNILPDWVVLSLTPITYAIITLMITSLLVAAVNQLSSTRIKKLVESVPEKETMFRLLNRLLVSLIYIVGGLVALSIIYPGVTGALSTLLLGAGFLGIVVGLAAQRVLGNLLSGININLAHPIRVGDAVMIKGEYGFVTDITLRHTVIRTWDNRRLIIPNSVLDDEVIINYTLEDPKKLFGIVLYVPYDTNIERVAQIMIEEAKKHPDVLPDLAPIFQILNFEKESIQLRLLFMAKDQGTAFRTAVELRRSIKKRFDEEGIKMSCVTNYIIPSQIAMKMPSEGVQTLNM